MLDIFLQLFGKILKTVGSQCPCGGHSNRSRIFCHIFPAFWSILKTVGSQCPFGFVVAVATSQEIGKC
jgi:hypothetical protein